MAPNSTRYDFESDRDWFHLSSPSYPASEVDADEDHRLLESAGNRNPLLTPADSERTYDTPTDSLLCGADNSHEDYTSRASDDLNDNASIPQTSSSGNSSAKSSGRNIPSKDALRAGNSVLYHAELTQADEQESSARETHQVVEYETIWTSGPIPARRYSNPIETSNQDIWSDGDSSPARRARANSISFQDRQSTAGNWFWRTVGALDWRKNRNSSRYNDLENQMDGTGNFTADEFELAESPPSPSSSSTTTRARSNSVASSAATSITITRPNSAAAVMPQPPIPPALSAGTQTEPRETWCTEAMIISFKQEVAPLILFALYPAFVMLFVLGLNAIADQVPKSDIGPKGSRPNVRFQPMGEHGEIRALIHGFKGEQVSFFMNETGAVWLPRNKAINVKVLDPGMGPHWDSGSEKQPGERLTDSFVVHHDGCEGDCKDGKATRIEVGKGRMVVVDFENPDGYKNEVEVQGGTAWKEERSGEKWDKEHAKEAEQMRKAFEKIRKTDPQGMKLQEDEWKVKVAGLEKEVMNRPEFRAGQKTLEQLVHDLYVGGLSGVDSPKNSSTNGTVAG